jgi:hypothetical protein
MARISFLLIFLTLVMRLSAQDRCGMVEIEAIHRKGTILKESNDQFERWIDEKKARLGTARLKAQTIVIPVVVHVVHKGEAVGSGVNIPDAQIISQIKVLNQDFTRTNSDASRTPAEFKPVAGSVDIQFVLAKQDPDGLPTSGIVRVKGNKSVWTINDESTLKSRSYWPAEDYLNIWVTDLTSSLLGYAQFPVSDLPGLEDAEDRRLTDGVVIDYAVFGTRNDGAFNLLSEFDLGRTTTHEVGHFLGLRHIWGDDNGDCGGDGDFVADTPDQGDNTNGCPSQPQTSCSVHTMFQNYMDYSGDFCMNLFTLGQIDRVNTVLQNSPRRLSLLSSHGADDPTPVANDLSIAAVTSPLANECSGPVSPVVRFVNEGSNAIVNGSVRILVNDLPQNADFTFTTPLLPGDTASIAFGSVVLSQGKNVVQFQITTANGLVDGKGGNNTISVIANAPYHIALETVQRFSSLPDEWHVVDDGKVSWLVKSALSDEDNNKALALGFFNSGKTGVSNEVLSPVFDLRNRLSPELIFDVAYARFSTGKDDGLKIYASTDCYQHGSLRKLIYSKAGDDLSTASLRTNSFVPQGEFEWRRETVSLAGFEGYSNFQLIFVGENAGGNNIYIDNVSIADGVSLDVAIDSVLSPSPVTCLESSNAVLRITNNGSDVIQNLKVKYNVNSGTPKIASYSGLSINASQSYDLTIPGVSLTPGKNKIQFEIIKPNQLFDVDTADNDITVYSVVDQSEDKIPLRENFDNTSNWLTVNPTGVEALPTVQTNFGKSLFLQSGTRDSLAEFWLVSPLLNMGSLKSASVYFDLSLARTDQNTSNYKNLRSRIVKVFVSTDCGDTYQPIQLDESFASAAFQSKSVANKPSAPDDWVRKYIDLSSLTIHDQIRIAFVLNNRTDCDVFLDNFEFFESADSSRVEIDLPYQVYGTDPSGSQEFMVTFNLQERQSVKYFIADLTGRKIYDGKFDDVLNQTVTIDPEVESGIYILHLQIGNETFSQRLYLRR